MAIPAPNQGKQRRNYDSVYESKFQRDIIDRVDALGKDGNEDTWEKVINDIISKHEWRRSVMHGLWRRSIGEPASQFEWDDPLEADGVPIKAREPIGVTKVNTCIHTPFDRTIVTNKSAYMVGNLPDVEAVEDKAIEIIEDHWKATKFEAMLLELAQSATRSGAGYTIYTKPKGENFLVLTKLPDWQTVLFYDSVTGNPKYGMMWFDEKRKSDVVTVVNWYDEKELTVFERVSSKVEQVSKQVHGVLSVPVVEWRNNDTRLGDVELSITTQDAHDTINSDLSSEITQLRMAYLNFSEADGADIDDTLVREMQESGIVIGNAKFITKDLNAQEILLVLKQHAADIYKYSNSYDPDEIGEAGNITATQIKQRLFKLEESSQETELAFKESLGQMAAILAKFNAQFNSAQSFSPEGIEYTFTRNVPQNVIEDVKAYVEAGGEISQETMAGLAPFKLDHEINQAQLAKERESMELPPIGPGVAVEEGQDTEAVEGSDQEVSVDKDVVLNGAQIKAAVDLAEKVGAKLIDREQAITILEVGFNIQRETAAKMV